MKKVIAIILVSCLTLIMASVFIGCDDGLAPGEELPSAEEIINGVIESQENLTTGRQDFDMDMDMNVSSGGIEGRITMSMSGEVAADFSNRNMEMEMSMRMDVRAMGQTDSMQRDILMYVIDDMGYVKADVPGEPGEWEAVLLSVLELDEIWEMADYVSGYADLLEGADITILKVQTVRGISCYVVEVEPSITDLANLIEQQQLTTDAGLPYDYSEMFKDFAVTYWIAKDSYNIIRGTVEATLQLEEAGDEIEGSMTMTVNGWDYGEPISIEPPAAALNAN